MQAGRPIKLNPIEILQYEIQSSWWAGYFWGEYAEKQLAKYFAWKVTRKLKRIEKFQKLLSEVEKNARLM